MSFLNQLTHLVFVILSAKTRRSNYKVPFHRYISILWVPHHFVGVKNSFHLECLLFIFFDTLEAMFDFWKVLCDYYLVASFELLS
jgi:hypothetical protein